MVGQHASQTRIVMVVRGRLMGGRIEHEDLTGTGAEDVSVAAVESGDLYAAFGHGGFRLVPGQRAARQLSSGDPVRRRRSEERRVGEECVSPCRSRWCQ